MGRTYAIAGAAAALALLAPARPPHPTVRILTTHPVRVRGAHFRAGETVRLTARAGDGPRRAHAVVDRHGAFAATFAYAGGGCSTLTVTAVGASGDRAVARLPRVAC